MVNPLLGAGGSFGETPKWKSFSLFSDATVVHLPFQGFHSSSYESEMWCWVLFSRKGIRCRLSHFGWLKRLNYLPVNVMGFQSFHLVTMTKHSHNSFHAKSSNHRNAQNPAKFNFTPPKILDETKAFEVRIFSLITSKAFHRFNFL